MDELATVKRFESSIRKVFSYVRSNLPYSDQSLVSMDYSNPFGDCLSYISALTL